MDCFIVPSTELRNGVVLAVHWNICGLFVLKKQRGKNREANETKKDLEDEFHVCSFFKPRDISCAAGLLP